MWSKHNKLYYSSFYGCDLKKNNFKKITFTCGWARQNIFLVKIVVWIVVWSKTRYNILVKIMVGIVVVYKMTKKKTQISLLFLK